LHEKKVFSARHQKAKLDAMKKVQDAMLHMQRQKDLEEREERVLRSSQEFSVGGALGAPKFRF
jgi:hypothetical protein